MYALWITRRNTELTLIIIINNKNGLIISRNIPRITII